MNTSRVRTRRSLLAFGFVAMLTATGCGGAPRDEVAEMFVTVAAESGFDVDSACVERVLGAMSDDDVTKLEQAGLDGDVELSDQGYAIMNDIANQCVDAEQYLDGLVANLAEDPTVDGECVRSQLTGLTSVDEVDRGLAAALEACTGQL